MRNFWCKVMMPVWLAACVLPAYAASPSPTTSDQFLEIETFPVWPAGPPNSKGNGFQDVPTLTVFRAYKNMNGTAVIIAPGGAYRRLAANLEGRQVADWFAARGVTAFVLKYRLGLSHPMPIPLEDARRAVQLIRANAATYNIDPDRIGMIGFSAGGHLTALVGTNPIEGLPTSDDPLARASSKINFMILGYPAFNMFADRNSRIAYCKLMEIARCPDAYLDAYRPEKQVTAQTPPTFLYQTTDDATVPAAGAITFYQSLVSAGVSAEMHFFAHGTHGSGLGGGDPALSRWPDLMDQWLRARKLIGPDVTPPGKPGP